MSTPRPTTSVVRPLSRMSQVAKQHGLMNLPPPPRLRPLFAKPASATLHASPDTLLLLICTWWVVTGNGAFWRALLAGRPLTNPASWGLVIATGTALIALHFCFIAPLAHRRTVTPLLSVLILVAAFAGYYMERFVGLPGPVDAAQCASYRLQRGA